MCAAAPEAGQGRSQATPTTTLLLTSAQLQEACPDSSSDAGWRLSTPTHTHPQVPVCVQTLPVWWQAARLALVPSIHCQRLPAARHQLQAAAAAGKHRQVPRAHLCCRLHACRGACRTRPCRGRVAAAAGCVEHAAVRQPLTDGCSTNGGHIRAAAASAPLPLCFGTERGTDLV